MVTFMSHEGFEPVTSCMSQGNGPQVSECYAKSAGQSRIIRRRRRRSSMPVGAKERRENEPFKDKNPHARDYYGRFRGKKGTAAGPKKVTNYNQPRDSKGRFLPMKGIGTGTEEGAIVNPYDSIVNLQPPDCTTMLRILYCKKGAKHYRRIERLKDPDFTTLVNAMNSIGPKPVDDGPYDARKVLMEADGWAA